MIKRTDCIIGVDPGLSGALAVYDPHNEKLVTVWQLPITTIIKDRKKKRNIDIHALATGIFEAVEEYGVKLAIIERVSSSPQMGIASAFKFGDGYGIVRALLEVYVPRVEYVSPNKWKARMMLGNEKAASVHKARQVFGNTYFTHISKDGLAEAALLALYAARDIHTKTEEEDPLS